MKKIIALVMCFSVVLLSACNAHETSKSNSEIADTAETTTETTTAATTSETTTIETTTAAATSETTTIETTATFSTAKSNFNDNDENNSDYANYNEKLKQADECFSILDKIYHLPLGSAGSTGKAIIASAHFLNWTESTTMTDDDAILIKGYQGKLPSNIQSVLSVEYSDTKNGLYTKIFPSSSKSKQCSQY